MLSPVAAACLNRVHRAAVAAMLDATPAPLPGPGRVAVGAAGSAGGVAAAPPRPPRGRVALFEAAAALRPDELNQLRWASLEFLAALGRLCTHLGRVAPCREAGSEVRSTPQGVARHSAEDTAHRSPTRQKERRLLFV
jgi:hypothetical protein